MWMCNNTMNEYDCTIYEYDDGEYSEYYDDVG